MKNTTSQDLIITLQQMYGFHTQLFFNALNGLSDADAHNRLGTPANHIAWIAGSMVYQRQVLGNALGSTEKQTSEWLFKGTANEGHKSLQEGVRYPALAEYNADWKRLSDALMEKLEQLSAKQLKLPDPFAMPEGDFTLQDTLVFCLDREAYCTGQIGLYRRLLGHPAMKWN